MAAGFVIEDIEIEGLERVNPGTVFVALPAQVGDFFDVSRSAEIIHAVYGTKLFDDVTLKHADDTLIISVDERPGVAEIIIAGNDEITTESMLDGLKSINIAAGQIYDRTVFERLRKELKQQYYALGKYAVTLSLETVELPDNQVNISIEVNEGETTRIREIRIIGNRRIDYDTLTADFQSGKPAWYEFFSNKDHYSKIRLESDLELMKNIYLDRGYLDFAITDVRVTLTPDKRFIDIVIKVSEQSPYQIGEIDITGSGIDDVAALKQQLKAKEGERFSRSNAIDSDNIIIDRLKEQGYAFAKVNTVPDKHRDEAKVNLLFVADPGERAYVRRITFSGTDTTNDSVFRHELRQVESAAYSSKNIDRSRRRLQRLPYITAVDVRENPVAGEDNQIDLDFAVEERLSGSFNIGAGLSDSDGAVFSISVTQDNFMGEGDRVQFSFNNSETNSRYGISVYDPHYTVDGISRSWRINYSSTDFEESRTSGTDSKELSLGLTFGIPVSEDDTLGLGARLQKITLGEPTSGTRAHAFTEREGKSFTNFILSASLVYDTRDRSLFPTTGMRLRGSVEAFVPGSDLVYSKLNYTHRTYLPLDQDNEWVLAPSGIISYARAFGSTEEVPFYDKFYAGGTKTVRGYRSNSLGARDVENDDPLGGDFRTIGSVNLFLPTGGLYDPNRLRVGLFSDLGNVFDDVDDFSFADLRGSLGTELQWLTPLGIINLNFATHYNNESDDETERFQLDFGGSF